MFGLLSCVFLQIVAGCVALVGDDYKFIWHAINNAGILIFAILALVLFYPILNDTKKSKCFSETEINTPTIIIPNNQKDEAFMFKIQDDQQIYSESTPSSLPSPSSFDFTIIKNLQ